MRRKIKSILMLFLLSSFGVHAGLTSVCEPQQNLGSYVSYIDKFYNENDIGGAASSGNFYNGVKATLKSGNTSNPYLDLLKPSKFKYNWTCNGPCSYESESAFIKLQYGVKMTANDIFKSSTKYLERASSGRTLGEQYLGLRNDIKFDGYLNDRKISAETTAAVDDLLNEAKRTGKRITSEQLKSIPGGQVFMEFRRDFKYLVVELNRNPKKPLIVSLHAFDNKGEPITGHSINIIVEGDVHGSTAQLLIISNGDIRNSFNFGELNIQEFKSALIDTFGESKSKVKDITYSTFRE